MRSRRYLDTGDDAEGAVIVDDRNDLEGQVDILGDAVGHEFEGAVRGHKCDGPLFVELP